MCCRVWISRKHRWRIRKQSHADITHVHQNLPHGRSKRVGDRIVVASVQLGDVSRCAADSSRRLIAPDLATRPWRPRALERHAARQRESVTLYVYETVVRPRGIGL